MYTKTRFLISFSCFLLVLSASSQAATFGTYDPRSLAMGGTGVSQANIDHAAYYNPALLSVAQDDDDLSLLVPTVGARVYDPEQFLESLEDHQDGQYETAMQNAVTVFQNSGTPAELQASAALVAENAQRLKDSLITLSGKELDLEVHAGVGLAIPGKSLGVGVIASGRAMTGVVVNITDTDQALVQEYIDAANDYADNGAFDGSYPGTSGSYPSAVCGATFCDAQFDSTVDIRGAVVTEGGISLSHEFESLGDLSIGVTPKTVRVSTYDYNDVTVENSTIDKNRGKLDYDDTNIDIGIAKQINDNWKFGLVVKNAVKKDYQTALGNTITLKPAARMGVSHHTNWTTLALDVDLTENARLGLTGEKTQYAALGMEFDLSLVQLRVGARHNLSAAEQREANMLSAGVGVYLLGFHADLAVAKNTDELAAALQLGFQF